MTLFTLPTSRRVTQEWNQDFNWLNGTFYPNGFYASIGWKGHNGIDYGCPDGDPVEAVCDGVIEYVGPGNHHPLLSGGGNTLLLRNDELGIRFEYLHLSQQNVYTGQKVTRGQVVALSGNTGVSTAPHLHLGAIPVRADVNNGYRGRVDPTPYLYGAMNPDYASGGIAAQGTTTIEEDDMFTDNDRAKLETALGKVHTLIGMLDNVAGAVNGTPSAVLDKQIPRANSDATTSLALFLAYADADRNATVARIQSAIANIPAPELAAQINAAGLAADVRDELIKLMGGKP